jgi:hypothetical protein
VTTIEFRRAVIAECRSLIVNLGVNWLRDFGPPRYGKARLAKLTPRQLAEVHTAAVAETAARAA